jgi:hypothetical protein
MDRLNYLKKDNNGLHLIDDNKEDGKSYCLFFSLNIMTFINI